jgi:hypothetical protein
MLLGVIDGMPPMLRFGQRDELTQLLQKVRPLVDGDGADWVSGEAANRLEQAIAQVLALLGGRTDDIRIGREQ